MRADFLTHHRCEEFLHSLALAQAQLRDRNPTAARRTLEPLFLPNVDAKLRALAEEMIQKIDHKR